MKRMFIAVLAMVMLAAIVAPAYALDYEDEPDIAVSFYGSNYFERGDQKTLTLVVYNNATREKVEYDDMDEAGFFGQNEDVLFTAYDVKFTLEGNDYIEVKTPTQSIPALPPMQPTTLNFVIKISDDAKAGKYELNLKATFHRIDGLKTLETYPNPFNPSEPYIPVQQQVQYEIVNGQETKNGTKIYIYQSMLKKYEIDYTKVTKTIPIVIYVEEKSVVLEVVSVQSEDLIGKGKGKITVEVRNNGDKTARSAYLVLDTPSGIEPQGLGLQSQGMPSAMPAGMMPGMSSMPMGMPMGLPGIGGMQGAQLPPTMSSLSTTKAAYYVGDLEPGETANATFYLKLDVKDEGVYPLHIKAVYLDDYERLTESESTTFGIHVKAAPSFEVVDVKSSVFVNAKGDVTVKLRPSTDLKDASVILTAKQPLSVLSAEYYVGDVRAGEEFTAVFKVKASDEAKPITYPAEITVKYKTMDEYFESDPVTVGVKVNPKMKFEVYGTPKIAAGGESVIALTIKNVGNFTIREATARLTITDPFSSDDDTAYIGTLKPGQTAEVKFKLSVDADATPKKYGLNLEVKYKDLEEEWAISEPTKAVIEVTPPQPPYGAIAIVAIIAIVAVAYYYLRRRRK